MLFDKSNQKIARPDSAHVYAHTMTSVIVLMIAAESNDCIRAAFASAA